MCNCYEYDLAEWEIRELVAHYTLIGRNWRSPVEVLPNQYGEVVVDRGGERTLDDMRWEPGFERWKSLVENKAQRCVVPATRFALSGRSAGLPAWQWFVRPNHKPFMFAGVWTTWHGERGTREAPAASEHRVYSIVSTEANALVQPFDDTMPVILTTAAEVEQWLTGTVQQALALHKSAANDALRLLPEEKKAA